MNEYYIELQDTRGTGYIADDRYGDAIYYEDIVEARLAAKGNLNDQFVLARIIDVQTRQVVDCFKCR